jgi:hydrogenase nickel incorporation protein HypA/HybF
MHEYSIVSALLDQVTAAARARQAIAVTRVQLAIGRAAGIEVELLRTAFEMSRRGTVAAVADLDVREVAATWACRACGHEVAAGGLLRCPDCGGPPRLLAGDEIVLERLEMEVP